MVKSKEWMIRTHALMEGMERKSKIGDHLRKNVEDDDDDDE